MCFTLPARGAHAQAEAAEAEAPASVEAAASPTTKLTAEQWERSYDKARSALKDGAFIAAAAALSQLAEQAPDATRKRVALEASWLALYWSKRGYALQVPSSSSDTDEGGGARPSKRTTDELAILYTSSVIYGVGSGVALAMLTEPNSAAGAILPTLALAGVSATAVYQIDKRVGLRYGAAQAMTSGLYIGFEEGLAWVLWQQEYARWENQLSAKQVASVLWATSTVGVVAGGLVGQLYGTTPGRASLMGSGAFWSALVVGFGVAAMTDNTQTALLSSAVALNVGAVGGVLLGNTMRPSIARVRFIDLGGVCGGLVLGGLYLAVADTSGNSRAAFGTIAAGFGGGLLAAAYLTRDMEPDDPRRPRDESQFSMVPTIAPSAHGHGGTLGLAGAF